MTFAAQMVAKYETLLLASAGLKMVMVDGQSITYGELEQKYDFWARKLAAETGTKPRASRIKLDGF